MGVEIEIDELLQLLSDRVKLGEARSELEKRRSDDLDWIMGQQKLLIATIQEFVIEVSQRIDDLEAVILGHQQRRRSLRVQLAKEIDNLNKLQEQRSLQGGDISLKLLNEIEAVERRILKIQMELNQMVGTQELKGE